MAWQYVKDFGDPFIVKIRESQLRVELFNGAWITLYGADNPDALRGLYLDGVVLDEYGDCRPSLWGQVVLPLSLTEKDGQFSLERLRGKTTFMRSINAPKAEDSWFDLTLPASESDVLDEAELLEMKAQMTEPAYNQELECDFEAAVLGTYYADLVVDLEKKGNIAPDKAKYNPDEKVFMACDLGFSDSTAMWFWQRYGSTFSVIDYYEAQGKYVHEHLSRLDSLGYDFDTLYFPHDARSSHVTGRSTIEQVQDHYKGTGVHIQMVPKLAVQHGIDAVRYLLPSCYINSVKCYDGIEALRAYRREFDEVKKVFRDQPLHDWASDGADAFRYFALAAQPEKKDQSGTIDPDFRYRPPQPKLDDLWKDQQTIRFGFEKLRIG